MKALQEQGQARVRQFAGYITRFHDAVAYKDYAEKGFPVGSGEIESAQRYIPQDRLKNPGACWHPDTVNPMLALRVLRQSGWWNDFWQSAAKAA
ncbi:MAG: hypothetical protein GY822_05045 [Deltaproteobacteria bacterium]|nr:hypothetical protein [Deltaproteobacteria bacterium]